MADPKDDLESALASQPFLELKDSGTLPSPSEVGLAVLCLTQREDCSLDEIARTIMSDPALTGQVLRIANQGVTGPAESIADVKDAAVRLGTRTVCHVALGFTLVSGNRVGTCACFDYDAYWSWSVACAAAVQLLSVRTGIGQPAQLFTGGLLARIGELALASVHPERYAVILDRLEEGASLDPLELETEQFRIQRCEVSRALLADWGLPDELATSVGHVGSGFDLARLAEPERGLVRLLRGGARLADLCMSDDGERHDLLSGLEALRKDLGLSEEAFQQLCDDVAASWRAWGETLSVPTRELPAYRDLRERVAEELAAPPAAPAAGRAPRRVGEPLRILAVDDDPMSLRLLEKHLESAGHHVTTARNGKEALVVVLETSPQVVVTDWMMPAMDGLEFTQALRRYGSGRAIYVLVLTSNEEEERIVEAFDAGVDDYVTKPFNPKVLLARVNAGQRVVRLQEQVEADTRTQREQVARLAVLTRKLSAAAMTDPLTDLPNRRYAMKRLQEEWSNGCRTGSPLSVASIDIDHFKRINDTYGHDAGDRVLREVATVIDRTTRDGDVTARIGGEEFLVICPNTEVEGAERCAERIREAVEAHVIEDPEFSGRVTVSVGVSVRGQACDSIDALLKAADEATYEAKAAGRNALRVHATAAGRRRSA